MGASYALRVIEGRLRDRLGDAPEFAGVSLRSTDGARKPSLGSNPRGWLYGIVMGSIAIPLDEASTRVLITAVADYLDPLIDGNVPAHATLCASHLVKHMGQEKTRILVGS